MKPRATPEATEKLNADLDRTLGALSMGLRMFEQDSGVSKTVIVRMRREGAITLDSAARVRAWIDAQTLPPVDPDEEWRQVVGYEGWYEISNKGRVRSVDRVVRHGKGGLMKLNGRIIRPNTHPGGHKMVCLMRDGHAFQAKVHRMVLEAFVGPCPESDKRMVGCHTDGNPANNHVENLRWDTQSANLYDAMRHGTHPTLARKRKLAAMAAVSSGVSDQEGDTK